MQRKRAPSLLSMAGMALKASAALSAAPLCASASCTAPGAEGVSGAAAVPLETHYKHVCRVTAEVVVQHPVLHPAPHHNTRCCQCTGRHSLEHTSILMLGSQLRAA